MITIGERYATPWWDAPLLTIGDAAKYLGVGRKVLYQPIERGEIIAVKSKRTRLIEKKSLDEFRAKGTLT
jgi:excisionase family DNA binding protein